ncbi:MAG TPA: hypothetical protein RMH99_26205 [Sandaracinaceae bacterium LLY-WYZ-13_1]|nr:hypothetical protein [Sandaracinaceae bacterium LLY-WYZ-13_1]
MTKAHILRGGVLLSLALGVALGGLVAPTSTAHAQEIQITGPLAGQPAVRRMRQYRTGHVQLIVPTVGYTLQDEFARSLMVGLEANVHFTDFLGVGVWGAMANFANAFQINTDLTSQISANGQVTQNNRLSLPTLDNFDDQVARLLGVASAHLIFAPLRGKLALFQGAFVDTDFYVLAGFAAAFVQERADVEDETVCDANTDACRATQTENQTRFAPTVMVGVGLNLYFNEFLGLALQWRAFPFDMNPMGTDFAGGQGDSSVSQQDGLITSEDQRFYFHHMVNIGLIINLPPEVSVSE